METEMTDKQMLLILRMILDIAEGSADKNEIVDKIKNLIDSVTK